MARMDSELILREMNHTRDRIEQTVRELDERARRAATRAARLGLLALTGAAAVAVTIVVVYAWRRRSSRLRSSQSSSSRGSLSATRRIDGDRASLCRDALRTSGGPHRIEVVA